MEDENETKRLAQTYSRSCSSSNVKANDFVPTKERTNDRRKRLNLIPDKPTYVSRLTATFYLPRTSLYRYLRALSTTNPLDSRENTKRWDRIVEIKRLSQDFIACQEIEEKAAENTLRFSGR